MPSSELHRPSDQSKATIDALHPIRHHHLNLPTHPEVPRVPRNQDQLMQHSHRARNASDSFQCSLRRSEAARSAISLVIGRCGNCRRPGEL